MTNEEMERAIEFLLNHHAQFSADIGQLKEAISRQTENIDKLTANVDAMREEMGATREEMETTREEMGATREEIEAMREEMREGFDKLILANEVTRRLTEEVAQLALQTSRRVTGLEHRVSDIEAKP
ncbi:MAG TPA: hypothetical protein VIS78_14255 [Blastocatellia bacterium]